MATSAEQLILRGLNLIIRTSFFPNDQTAQAKHFMSIQNDIGPWLRDYAEEIAKPASDDPAFLINQDRSNGGLPQ